MESLFSILTINTLIVALCLAALAGTIKGTVGFGMPMVMISGLSTFLDPQIALAGLLLPTLASNLMQAFRQGGRAALDSVRKFRFFLIAGFVTLVVSAQFVRVISSETLLIAIGVPVAVFAMVQLLGLKVTVARATPRLEIAVGAFAGAIGGVSGVWGPPTVMYLTALNTEKTEQMRVQGVIYGLGALTLVGAHIGSGVLRAETVPFSLAMVPPAILGMWIGGRIQDRIDQATFRKATLFILVFAALNLVRRAVMG